MEGSAQPKAAALHSSCDGAGRKHQIRIHCKHAGAPVVGDSRHGITRSVAQNQLMASLDPAARSVAKGRLMLHARSITVEKGRVAKYGAERGRGSEGRARTSPVSIQVQAPVPEHFQAVLDVLGFTMPE